MIWYVVAFLAGVLFWYQAGSFILRRALRSEGVLNKSLKGLSQESLVKTYKAVLAEIELRKKGVS